MTWTSHGKGKIGRFDRHDATGWEVHHCGHPTANWPWYAISPEGESVASDGGYAWRKLDVARTHIEELVAGERVISYRFLSQGFGRAVRVCSHPDCIEAADVTSDSYRYGVPACAAHDLHEQLAGDRE
jgi:hypothetical protein